MSSQNSSLFSSFLHNIQSLFRPTVICESVHDIDFPHLREEGIKNLFIDVDNTLVSYKDSNVPIQCLNLLTQVRRYDFNIILLSNNADQHRIEEVAKQLQLPSVSFSCKPFLFTARRLMNDYNMTSDNTAIIGDQVLTDILLGNLLSIRAIFVEPINISYCSFLKKIQYKFQNLILEYI